MSLESDRDKWLQDIEMRQRNIVFPDTVQNEGRFWRNIQNPAFSGVAKMGLFLFGVALCSFVVGFLLLLVQNEQSWGKELLKISILVVLIFGPILAAVIWGTRRALRVAGEQKDHKHS